MKNLLRSCFLADPTADAGELFAHNYHAMVDSGLGFDTPEDNIIWTFIQDFFKSHGHVPEVRALRSHFSNVQEMDVVDRIERLSMIKARTRGDFLSYLEEKATDRRNRIVLDLAKEMAQIVQTGIEIKDPRGNSTKLHGSIDAIRHVLDRSHDIVAPTLGSKLSGNLMQDEDDFIDRYDRIKADPLYGMGQQCGISQIDATLNGAKRYELWLHTAFTGGLKSTFALHWAYIQAVYYRASSFYASLEMPYMQCRNIICAMHSAHEKFREVREQLGIQTDPTVIGLEYERIRDGKLYPNEEQFLKQYVAPDIFAKRSTAPATGPHPVEAEDYGEIHIRVADPDKNDYTMNDLRSQAELTFSKTPFRMMFVDHVGLMSSRGRYSSTTEKLNEVIRDLKRLAMSFNRGMGIAVVGLFQISREGYRSAEKNGGRYNLTHLSYANEAERSSDIVTSTWIDDELRKLDKCIFQCLKSRDQKPFDRVPVRVEFSCRRLLSDNTPIEELDQKVKDAKGGDDDDKKDWKRKTQQQVPNLDLT
jgi:replicative DNA helicase